MAKTKKHRKAKSDAEGTGHHGPRGLRPFWSGTISFGLVSVPVNIFPATRHTRTSLRMLDVDGTPLARRFYCPAEGREVHPEHILRGHEVEEGKYIVVRDEELEALAPKKSREIDLQQFVDLAEVPPLLFERSYILTPAGESMKAYRLLAEVMEHSQRAGIATFVMRDREYLVAILAKGGILRAQMLRFNDEVRTPDDVDLPDSVEASQTEVARMKDIIEKLTSDRLHTDELDDDTEERLKKLVAAKHAKGKDVVQAADYEPTTDSDADDGDAIDLLEVIRRNLQGGNGDNGHRTNASTNGALAKQSKDELYERATELDIAGRSKMNKGELIRAIRGANNH
jgi:DNA end-binding protein Ku